MDIDVEELSHLLGEIVVGGLCSAAYCYHKWKLGKSMEKNQSVYC